jgi:hypothetical protein
MSGRGEDLGLRNDLHDLFSDRDKHHFNLKKKLQVLLCTPNVFSLIPNVFLLWNTLGSRVIKLSRILVERVGYGETK